MSTALIVIHLILAIGLVGLVLIQHGKGADMGTAFGAGASGSVFGSSGAGNLLTRSTAILAGLFFLISLALAYFAMQTGQETSLMETVTTPTIVEPAPATDLPTIPAETATETQSSVPNITE